jgi:lysozyme
MQMLLSAKGLKALERLEALRLMSYLDEDGVLTTGWGHTGPDVPPEGGQVTLAQAEAWLAADCAWASAAVNALVTAPLTQFEFDALVLFTYNVGPNEDGFAGSTLLARLNAGDFLGAANEFARWNKVDGRVCPGLVNRRASERAIFIHGIYDA